MPRSRIGSHLALAVSCLSMAALAVQFVLTVHGRMASGESFLQAAWHFLGLFTYLCNGFVVVCGLSMALRPTPSIGRRRVHLSAAAAIAMVGVIWSLLLRGRSTSIGLEHAMSHVLHDIVPLLFVLAWVVSDHGGLRWRDGLWAAAVPLAYTFYILIRAKADGWYPYWFIDAGNLTALQLARNLGLIIVAFTATGMALVCVDRRLALRSRRA